MTMSCESVARFILPIYRSMVAKELINKYNMTQNQVAEKLGTTQAAISQYVNSKRGGKGVTNFDEIQPVMEIAASKIAQKISAENLSPDDFRDSFCELCLELRNADKCK